jgi:DNA-binding Lrp family transcriptional regulator
MARISDNLLNDYQHTFPLVSEPFNDLARDLNCDVKTVLNEVKTLKKNGTISRIGPVFKPNTVGVSTLAAISVPPEELERYAQIVNRFPQVNHNYEREHEINLWFVLTAADQADLDATIRQIEKQTEHSVLVLPLLKEYHIDLGFNLRHLNKSRQFAEQALLKKLDKPNSVKAQDLNVAKDLIAAIQGGLPLVERPYQVLADRLDLSEGEIIDNLKTLIRNGAIKRFGVIVRHHEMGYRANAMVVWDVPDEQIDQIGKSLGDEDCITLCYQRPRALPRWPYNLFCMIHGKNRDEVLSCISQVRNKYDLEHIHYEILFSGKRFKQRGARYRNISAYSSPNQADSEAN